MNYNRTVFWWRVVVVCHCSSVSLYSIGDKLCLCFLCDDDDDNNFKFIIRMLQLVYDRR